MAGVRGMARDPKDRTKAWKAELEELSDLVAGAYDALKKILAQAQADGDDARIIRILRVLEARRDALATGRVGAGRDGPADAGIVGPLDAWGSSAT